MRFSSLMLLAVDPKTDEARSKATNCFKTLGHCGLIWRSVVSRIYASISINLLTISWARGGARRAT